MSIAGLDLGTTGCKVTIFDDSGHEEFNVYQSYEIKDGLGSYEIDAEAIWDGVCSVLIQAGGRTKSIRGLGITSFGETFVALDAADVPIAPCMLYTDPRGISECKQLTESIGKNRIVQITGLAPHSMYSLPKIMWMKEQRPDLFVRAKRICLMADYVAYRLTGVHRIDYSLATRMMAFDINTLKWSSEILQSAGVDEKLFGEPVPTGTSSGPIKRKLAEELGLPADMEVVMISHDQVAAAVGSGVFEPGQAVDGAGTVECITPVYNRIPTGKELEAMSEAGFAIVPYVVLVRL